MAKTKKEEKQTSKEIITEDNYFDFISLLLTMSLMFKPEKSNKIINIYMEDDK